ncbi:glycosyltransferase family 2 protein, partial [Candidatus Bathyarchaeota archaeon]|nr:glycosyltransferase family 2 protein [Candidatus Bathyarchaeota archaeon]
MRLSVIVCAYNEENSIGPLLENLVSQKVPPEIVDREIIVVASGCTDGTVDVVKKHMQGRTEIKLIEEKTRLGKASALNKAFEASTGEYIALVPADVEPASNALFSLLLPFRNEDVSAVSGRPMQNPLKAPKGLVGYLAKMTYRLWGRLMSKLNDRG